MLLGVFFSFVQGITMPVLGLFFGEMTNILMQASVKVSNLLMFFIMIFFVKK